MTRGVIAGLVIALGVLLTPGAAGAKGAQSVIVRGPGLDAPIQLAGDRIAEAHELASISGFFVTLSSAADGEQAEHPAEDLGPGYVATYRWMVGPDETVPIRQQLYPFAHGGAITYTRPRQPMADGYETSGGWYRAGDRLTAYLRGLGVPADERSRTGGLGISVAYPPGWSASSEHLTALIDPAEAFAVGTYQLRPTASSCPTRAYKDLDSTDVFILGLVSGRVPASLPARPAQFTHSPDWSTKVLCRDQVRNGTLRLLNFEERGRHVLVFLALGDDVTDKREAEAYAILDSLVVE